MASMWPKLVISCYQERLEVDSSVSGFLSYLKCPFSVVSFSFLTHCLPSSNLIFMFPSSPVKSLSMKIFLILLPREIQMSSLEPFLLNSLSWSGKYSILILYFAGNSHLWVSTYNFCLTESGSPHTGCCFSISIHLPSNFLKSSFLTAG